MSGPLAITGALLDGREVGMRIENGLIAELGTEVKPREGDELLDGAGKIALPGLVNGHTHAAMTLFRGFADDLPLMEWLERHIWPAEAKLDDEDIYWGTRLACLEMIRTGTIRFWDVYWRPTVVARAVADAGLRAVIGAPLIDGGPGTGAEARAKLRGEAEQALDALGELAAPGVEPALGPHAIYTVSDESLVALAKLAGERSLPVQIHLSETRDEVEACVERSGKRPAELLDALGLLGERTLLAHGVWLSDAELELIAERGATVVSNPVANLKLAAGGPFPYPAARERGVRLGLGTDGAGSNNSLDLLADAKAFALIQKHAAGDAAAAPAGEVWALATGMRSPLLGGGELAVGAPGDLILVRGDDPALAVGELGPGLVYAASGAVVDATIVAGRVLMRDGAVDGAGEVVARAAERAARLKR